MAKKQTSVVLEEFLDFTKEVVSDYKFHESEQRMQEDFEIKENDYEIHLQQRLYH